ncbi:CBO0543 family protein [Perspicuibacillus lycopersici]|uniref:CBO0543 family protein n=1 Tax=Perspicuibacillus lycopersici TaxID=1325689 RepID=UPI002952FA07|nr:CBO0543 family protein [Perspicuibacillus lycopersici]
MKDWLIIFLLKSYVASFLDTLIVKKGYIKYPVNLFKSFNISVLFSYLIYPVTCIYFSQVTKNAKLPKILLVNFLFTLPSTLVESWLEKNTRLIEYKKSWTSFHSFASIFSTTLIVRLLLLAIRRVVEDDREG